MLLTELRRLAGVLAADLPREGFADRRVRYVIDLDARGHLVEVRDMAEGNKPPASRGVVMQVPDVIRTTNVRPLLVVDKPAYVFGMDPKWDQAYLDRRHTAYRKLLIDCGRETGLPQTEAILRYLDT